MGKAVLIAAVLMLVAGDNGRGEELLPAPTNTAPPAKIESPPPGPEPGKIEVLPLPPGPPDFTIGPRPSVGDYLFQTQCLIAGISSRNCHPRIN
jgi:hypothetical protein